MCHVRERFDIVKTARLRVPKDPIMIPLQPTMHNAKKERCVDFFKRTSAETVGHVRFQKKGPFVAE